MQNTMTLIDSAVKIKGLTEWASELGLSKRALYTAKDRGHLSPAIAGVLAEKLGENVSQWIVIAALESERESACKTHLISRLASLYLSLGHCVGFFQHRRRKPTCLALSCSKMRTK